MRTESRKCEILIVGGGPAGLAAAAAAAASGAQIDLIDENFQAGGQIWRGGAGSNPDPRARLMGKPARQNQCAFSFSDAGRACLIKARIGR